MEKWQAQSEYTEQVSRPLMDEARWRVKIWMMAADASYREHAHPFPWQRRVLLKSLLEELGPQAYYSGQLPAPVPTELLRMKD